MIPKIIHYCWFGGKEEPESVKRCIRSWKKYCPDYQIIRWDETNYDVKCCFYSEEAYREKKWAFVSDYARLKIIYENGGIYLDTDVELIKSFDGVLKDDYFLGIEKDEDDLTKEQKIQVATGLGFGAVKGNMVIKALLDDYKEIHFVEKGKKNTTPCPIRNTHVLEKMGFRRENCKQFIQGGIIYPAEYFCPEEYSSKQTNYSVNTISIHHFTASWRPSYVKIAVKLINTVKSFLGGNRKSYRRH